MSDTDKIPVWTPTNSTMGNIENSAILTVSIISQTDRRAALRDINALFKKLRQGPKEDEDTLQDFF